MIRLRVILFTSLLVLSLGFFQVTTSLSSPVANAQAPDVSDVYGPRECSRSILGLPVWFKYLTLDSSCDIVGPVDSLSGEFDWQRAAGYVAIAVLEILLRIGALVAVGFVMYGGFRFITSQGDPEGAKNARNTIINAVIGLVITIASASIVAFIANRLTS